MILIVLIVHFFDEYFFILSYMECYCLSKVLNNVQLLSAEEA